MARIGGRSTQKGRSSRRQRGLWVGLTGSLASGKSTSLNVFALLGWRTLSSDEVVAKIYKKAGLTKEVLRKKYGHSRAGIKRLERWVHPKVKKEILEFLKKSSKPAVVEVPLLFEAKFDRYFDRTIFVYSPLASRRRRAIKRGMDPKLFDFLNAQQWTDARKRKCADFVLENDSKKILRHQIQRLSKDLSC